MNSQNIRLGDSELDEKSLLAKLDGVKRSVQVWARRRGLWRDTGFLTPYIHRGECPRRGDILYLWFEGPLFRLFNGYTHGEEAERCRKEFEEILKTHGFKYDLEDHTTVTLFPADERVWDDFLALYRWQWLKELATNRLFDLHAEVFQYVAKRPGSLQGLSWREYEEFLDAVFRNQGFHTELGPGGDDGGVDIRLYRSSVQPELVTLVQAKRYRTRPIGLETVASLLGVAVEQRAVDAILVTTSRFLPKAKKFARTTQSRIDLPSIELADSQRVAEWCRDISESLRKFYLGGRLDYLPIALTARSTELTGKIVVAGSGYNTIRNYFCVIDADFSHEAILRAIPTKVISDDGYSQRGQEVGDLSGPPNGKRFVAMKRFDESGRLTLWGDRHLFVLWDGMPRCFDFCD